MPEDKTPINDESSNVVRIRAKTSIKIKAKDLVRATCDAMMGKPIGWPIFKRKFHVIKDFRGERILVEDVGEKVLQSVPNSAIDEAIMSYWSMDLIDDNILIGPQATRDVKECREFWLLSSGSLQMGDIKPVGAKSDTGNYCFHRLDFTPGANMPDDFDLVKHCPKAWDILGRTSNRNALMTWIGSLFDAKSARQEYVWLHGIGGDGKGTLIRMLAKLFGPSFASEQPPGSSDRFWTSGLIGKRLVVFADVNDASFVRTGIFKSLTGGDMVRGEIKNGPVLTLDLNAKYLFSSNKKPDIDDSNANLRRIIYCHVGRVTTYYEGDYEGELWREMPLFISHCWNLYAQHRRTCGAQAPIPSEKAEIREIAGYSDSEFDNIIEHHFAVMPLLPDVKQENQPHVKAMDIDHLARYYFKNSRRERSAFTARLRDVTGARSALIKSGGSVFRAYLGIERTCREPVK